VLLEVNYSPDYGNMLKVDLSFLTGMMERLFLVPLEVDASIGGMDRQWELGCVKTEQGVGARSGGGDGGCRYQAAQQAGPAGSAGGWWTGGEERQLHTNHEGAYSPSCAHWERLHM
jgi:hypothetical protein